MTLASVPNNIKLKVTIKAFLKEYGTLPKIGIND